MLFPLIMPHHCRVQISVNSWWRGFHHFSKSSRASFSFKVLASGQYGPNSRYNKTENRRSPLTTQTEGKTRDSLCNRATIRQEIADEINISKVDVYKPDITEVKTIEYNDIRQKIVESKELASLITFVVFDLETTGRSRVNDRIIEIALRDLSGGENSTFQTLVNPEREVGNEDIHKISTQMVSESTVPRMAELIPILFQYISSRQKPGGYVVWIAHNARTFDVPFLISEFTRCSYSIPSNWLFIDTVPLGRQVMKLRGETGYSLQTLREHYNIPLVGMAHRAMADANVLALVFRNLTIDLKLTIPDLIAEHSIGFLELADIKKKKKKKTMKKN